MPLDWPNFFYLSVNLLMYIDLWYLSIVGLNVLCIGKLVKFGLCKSHNIIMTLHFHLNGGVRVCYHLPTIYITSCDESRPFIMRVIAVGSNMVDGSKGTRGSIVALRQRSNCKCFTTLHVSAITWQNVDASMRTQPLHLKDVDSPSSFNGSR